MVCGAAEGAGRSTVQATTAYRRREPEEGALYRVLAEHLEAFLSRASADDTRPPLPRFVELLPATA